MPRSFVLNWFHGVGLASLVGAALTLAACGRSPPPTPSAAVVSEPQSAADLKPVLPAAWTSCTSDDDCTYVTDGCCATLAVNRASLQEGQARLHSTPHKYCPVKAACGNGRDGTKAGTPGSCAQSTCR